MVEPKIQCVGYVRLSQEDRNLPKEQLETSLINQRKDIEEFCKKTNRDLIKIYEDRYYSGNDKFRPAFTEMMIDGQEKQLYKEIIIKDSSRFMRDEAFFKTTLIELEQVGIKVFSLMEGHYLSYRNMGDRFIAMSHEYFVLKGQEDYAKMLARKQENGEVLGSPVYGYKWQYPRGKVPKGEINNWIIDKKCAEIVIKVFEFKDKESPTNISKQLNIPIRKYYKILENEEVYRGFIILKRKIKEKIKIGDKIKYKTKLIDTIKYKGNHPPILSLEPALLSQIS